jgi:proton-translocating NADH-quinone oxidoreductase chain M
MLLFIILLLLISTVFLIINGSFLNLDQKRIQSFSLMSTVICFFLSIFFWVFFDRGSLKYQFILKNYLLSNGFSQNLLGHISFGIDGISLFFILLSTFIVPLCLLTSYKTTFIRVADYCLYFLILEIFLILSFTAMDIISFFIFFESILIPMFFIIGIWGSRERRIRAGFLFFLYTLFGSIFLFFSLLVLYYDSGTCSFGVLTRIFVDIDKQLILWLFLYLAFSVKIPTIPMHVWLPEAHVEAPTAGSVILAGLLLKLGGYGFIRVLLPIFAEATIFYLPLIDTFCLISIIYASLTTIRQIDMKRIIAYSSVAHMNLVVLGIFSNNIQGISGSIFLMLAHGIVSSALFFSIGVLYDKYTTRIIYYYGGLVQTMPIFSTFLLIFCLGNIGLPGTCNFIGELTVFVGLVEKNFFILVTSVTGVILSVLYTMYFCNRVIFGNLNLSYIYIYNDMLKREFFILLLCAILTFLLGLMPNLIFDTILTSVSLYVTGIL